MNKAEFLDELNKKLKRLPKEEIESALQYYNDYFDDAGLENEHGVINELGSPAKVASAIIADYAVGSTQEFDGKLNQHKKSISAVKFITIAVLTAPIKLPAAVGLISLLLIAVALAATVVLTCYAFVVSFLVGGFWCIISGFGVLTQSPITTVMFAGFGLAFMGAGLLLAVPSTMLSRRIFMLIAKTAAKVLAGIKTFIPKLEGV